MSNRFVKARNGKYYDFDDIKEELSSLIEVFKEGGLSLNELETRLQEVLGIAEELLEECEEELNQSKEEVNDLIEENERLHEDLEMG